MPINLGAAFHPELTREAGHAIAAETRSLGIHEILVPNLVLAEPKNYCVHGIPEAARSSDVVILVCGDNKVTSGEGMDRWDLKLYGKQQELIRKVSELGKPTVLVLENGKPVDLTYEAEHLDSILAAWFGGEFGAKAIADILFGEVSPSYLKGEKKERFEFGFGMSYTQFVYENLRVEKGEFKIMIGASSRDIRLETVINIEENVSSDY